MTMTSSTSQEKLPKATSGAAATAGAPFNLPSADVVFQSADNVEFHLHKSTLSIASAFFNDMFFLAQPSQTTTLDIAIEDRIRVTEDSVTFDALLRLLYPVADPPLTDRKLVEQMLEAALKYQLDVAADVLRSAWRLFIPQHTLSIFATACRLQLQDEARMAAEEWKKKVVWTKDIEENRFGFTLAGASYVDEMASMSAGTYFRFLYFLGSTPSPTVNFIDPVDPSKPDSSNTAFCEALSRSWDADPTEVFSDTDIILRSRDGVNISAHHLIIRLAAGEQLLAVASDQSQASGSESTVYEVDADAYTLHGLVRLCYPCARVEPKGGLRQLDAIMQLAQKYEVQKVMALIKEQYIAELHRDPLLVYLISMKWGWIDEARKAATLAAQLDQPKKVTDMYSWAMEDVSAEIYIQLLKHVHTCRVTIAKELYQRFPLSLWKEVVAEHDYKNLVSVALDFSGRGDQLRGSFYANGCYDCRNHRGRPDCSCRVPGFRSFFGEHRQLQLAIQEALAKNSFDSKWSHFSS
ncbi:hypothetical protein BC835DRAFT_678073 [Cytidiella melzeri]|nr:hypothetical protein BC835DRAFT_678073 [Cytidiella melzeri]